MNIIIEGKHTQLHYVNKVKYKIKNISYLSREA